MSREDIILITNTKTNICRSFAIINPNWVKTVKKYMEVRLKLSGNRKKNFMRYEKILCINSPIGINTIKTISNKIDKYLNLDCPMDTRLKFLKRFVMTDGLPSTSKTKCTVLQLQLKQW
jgi:hypothetical protein